MIHGWAGSSRQYRRIALRLTEEGYRCVVIDLPAHGIEAGGSTHAFEMADAIEIAGNALGKVGIVVAQAPGLLSHQALESFAAILRLRPVVAKAVEHSTITPETRRDLLERAGIIPEVNAPIVPLIW